MANGLLVLMNRLALVECSQRCQLRRFERTSISAKNADAVLANELAHGLLLSPGCTPYGRRSTIGEHQLSITPADKMDTDREGIQDQLQQRSPRFRLSVHTAFALLQAALLRDVPAKDDTTDEAAVCVAYRCPAEVHQPLVSVCEANQHVYRMDTGQLFPMQDTLERPLLDREWLPLLIAREKLTVTLWECLRGIHCPPKRVDALSRRIQQGDLPRAVVNHNSVGHGLQDRFKLAGMCCRLQLSLPQCRDVVGNEHRPFDLPLRIVERRGIRDQNMFMSLRIAQVGFHRTDRLPSQRPRHGRKVPGGERFARASASIGRGRDIHLRARRVMSEQLVCRTVQPDTSARRIMDRERIGKSLDDRVKSPAQAFGGAAGLLHLAGQETDRKPDGQVHEQVQSILDARNHEREHWWQEQQCQQSRSRQRGQQTWTHSPGLTGIGFLLLSTGTKPRST